MTIQIDTTGRIILDGEQTLFLVAQAKDGTKVLNTTGHLIAMPHSRYNLTSSYGLNPGVAGLDQFEMDVRRIVQAAQIAYLCVVSHNEGGAKHTPGSWFYDEENDSGIYGCKGSTYIGAAVKLGTDEGAANARLMATAPELLAAARLALQLIKDTNIEEHGNAQVGAAWGALADSIEKATGIAS